MTPAQEVSDSQSRTMRVPAASATFRLLTDITAEGRVRTKFQKSISDGNVTGRRLDSSTISTKGVAEPRSNFTGSRRQSIRDQKAPLGPRPPDFPASKR